MIVYTSARMILASGIASLFLGLCIIADELYGVAIQYGPGGLYYWPVYGPMPLWPSWIIVFTGIVLSFFLYGLVLVWHPRVMPGS